MNPILNIICFFDLKLELCVFEPFLKKGSLLRQFNLKNYISTCFSLQTWKQNMFFRQMLNIGSVFI